MTTFGLWHPAAGWVQGVTVADGLLAFTDEPALALTWRTVDAARTYARAQALGPDWHARTIPEGAP